MISAKYVQKVTYTMDNINLSLDKRFTYNPDKDATKLGTAINYLSKLTNNDFKQNEDIAITYNMPVGTPPFPYFINGQVQSFNATVGKKTTGKITVAPILYTEYEYLKYEILSMSVYINSIEDTSYLEFYTSGRYDTLTGTLPITILVSRSDGFKNYNATAQIQSVRGNLSYSVVISIKENT